MRKKKDPYGSFKRETGLEPATSTLARLHSTTELLSHPVLALPFWNHIERRALYVKPFELSNKKLFFLLFLRGLWPPARLFVV